MENHKLIDKLKAQTHVSYEEAKIALEASNWDILDAIIYLEELGKVQKPATSIFYTGAHGQSNQTNETNDKNSQLTYSKESNTTFLERIFMRLCKAIDTCNNIFFEIKKSDKILLKFPVTVIIVLLIFSFGTVIFLYIIGLFFELDFSLSGKNGNTTPINKCNTTLKLASDQVKKLKKKLKRGDTHG